MKRLTENELFDAKRCYCVIWSDPEDETNIHHYKLYQYVADARRHAATTWNGKIRLCINGYGRKIVPLVRPYTRKQ